MKKLLALLLIVSLKGIGQIEVKPQTKFEDFSKVTRFKEEVAYIKYTVKEDTLFFFTYRNQEYKTLNDTKYVMFSGMKTLDDLSKIMLSVFLEENKSKDDFSVSFNLGKDDVYVSTIKSGKTTLCYFSVKHKGHTTLTEKEVKELFKIK